MRASNRAAGTLQDKASHPARAAAGTTACIDSTLTVLMLLIKVALGTSAISVYAPPTTIFPCTVAVGTVPANCHPVHADSVATGNRAFRLNLRPSKMLAWIVTRGSAALNLSVLGTLPEARRVTHGTLRFKRMPNHPAIDAAGTAPSSLNPSYCETSAFKVAAGTVALTKNCVVLNTSVATGTVALSEYTTGSINSASPLV